MEHAARGRRYVFPLPDAEYWDPANRFRFPDKVGEEVNAGFFLDSVQPILDRQTITVTSRGETAGFAGEHAVRIGRTPDGLRPMPL